MHCCLNQVGRKPGTSSQCTSTSVLDVCNISSLYLDIFFLDCEDMDIATRIANEDDKVHVWTLYQSALKPHIESIWGWDEAWQVAYFEKAFSTSATYVLEAGSEIAGYIQLDINNREIYLAMLVLAPNVRSKGIGAKLLAEISRLAHQAGRTMHLRVFRVNGAAKRFYEREGWRVKAEEDAFFLMTHPLNETNRSTKVLRVEDFEMFIQA